MALGAWLRMVTASLHAASMSSSAGRTTSDQRREQARRTARLPADSMTTVDMALVTKTLALKALQIAGRNRRGHGRPRCPHFDRTFGRREGTPPASRTRE